VGVDLSEHAARRLELCSGAGLRVYPVRMPDVMPSPGPDRFVRVPTPLLEALLRARLTGTEWQVLLWVIRHTDGWNRQWAPFTWYRMAKDLGLDRAGAYRAGQALLRSNILVEAEGRVAVQRDDRAWASHRRRVGRDGSRQLWIPGLSVARTQRRTLFTDNENVAGEQRERCRQATVFRRAKDSIKERKKKYIDTPAGRADGLHRPAAGSGPPRTAGAARPVPGKYDGLSQN
jgi:phage replication O-like protein O